jgi:hypothetical protein
MSFLQKHRQKSVATVALAAGGLALLYLVTSQIFSMQFSDVKYRTIGKFIGDVERQEMYQGTKEWEPAYPNADRLNFVTPLYPVKEGEWEETDLPLYAFSAGNIVEVEFNAHVLAVHPWQFRIVADDCLQSLEINGKVVMDSKGNTFSFCNLEGKSVNLSGYLTGGSNHIKARIRDDGGFVIFRFGISGGDPLYSIFKLIVFSTLFGAVGWFLWIKRKKHFFPLLIGAVAFCAGIALIYSGRFTYSHFSYDADGHVNYIEFLHKMWVIPPAEGYSAEGWQFYQPPLYYALASLWWLIGAGLERSQAALINDTETLSWLLMTLSLSVCAWIATKLFSGAKERMFQPLFILLIGTVPGVVFMSSRISNDVLLFFICTLFFALLLQWWGSHSKATWIALWVLIAAALLTKTNGMILVPVALITVFFKKGITWPRKILMTIGGGILSILLIAWYLLLRVLLYGETSIVGNLNALHIGLRFDPSISQLLIFNPIGIFQHPFNNPWSDEFRRSFYWEYLYRSAFFGEWDFGHKETALAGLVLLLGIPMVAIGVYGLYRKLRADWRGQTPIWAMASMFLLAGIAYRTVAPYGCNQDFRFIAPVIIPASYYVLSGIQLLPKSMQKVSWHILSSFLFCTIAFIFSIVAFFGT